MHIFPEGTRTNGRYLIKFYIYNRFSKGAFFTGSKIHLIVFKYHRNNNSILNNILILFLWRIRFEIIDLGIFNPEYLKISDYEN